MGETPQPDLFTLRLTTSMPWRDVACVLAWALGVALAAHGVYRLVAWWQGWEPPEGSWWGFLVLAVALSLGEGWRGRRLIFSRDARVITVREKGLLPRWGRVRFAVGAPIEVRLVGSRGTERFALEQALARVVVGYPRDVLPEPLGALTAWLRDSGAELDEHWALLSDVDASD